MSLHVWAQYLNTEKAGDPEQVLVVLIFLKSLLLKALLKF